MHYLLKLYIFNYRRGKGWYGFLSMNTIPMSISITLLSPGVSLSWAESFSLILSVFVLCESRVNGVLEKAGTFGGEVDKLIHKLVTRPILVRSSGQPKFCLPFRRAVHF